MPDMLQADSIQWAKAHIERFGDTDVFPTPFEFKAIFHSWTRVKQQLESVDIEEYAGRPAERYLVPKSQHGFRVSVHLDPLDSVLFCAMVREHAEQIESMRVPVGMQAACSYRIATKADGTFFRSGDGWKDFVTKCESLSSDKANRYVAVADISDFYNQIYHHRVCNAFELAGVAHARAKNVETFLGRVTAKQSRGIPVGPAASIVLAEATLHDVDMYLIGRGHYHARYVDDFRVFCRTEQDALRSLHDLTEYLFTSHRLSLQSSKTHVLPIATFKKRYLQDPEAKETQGLLDKTKAIINEMFENTGYTITEADVLSSTSKTEMVHDNLKELLAGSISQRPISLGVARYALKRAAALRTRKLDVLVLRHLSELVPCMREVVHYLHKTHNTKASQRRREALSKFISDAPMGWVPYNLNWILWLITEHDDLLTREEAISLADRCIPVLGCRWRAQLARKYKDIAWIRGKKETWASHQSWDRRAIIWAGAALPFDERNAWLGSVQDTPDLLDSVVAKCARA